MIKPRVVPVLALLAIVLTSRPVRGDGKLPERAPASLGFDEARLRRIDEAVDRSIEKGDVPGAVVIVGRRGAIAYVHAAGRRAVEPKAEPMTRDTVFDMASLTKPLATATSIMILIEEGKLQLQDRVVRFLPELDNHGKGRITVEHLLRHRAGLVPDNPLKDYADGPDEAWKRIANIDLVTQPGERFAYSDVGFLILGKLVERISGQTLDRFASERIFQQLGMTDAHFRPLGKRSGEERMPVERIAPTEKSEPNGPMLRGVVHDPRSRALGGVAGHAGLFASALDLAIFASALLSGGASPDGHRILAPLTVRAMFDPGDTPAGQKRGLGWDIATGYSSPRGALFGSESLGHTGFTGTSLWMDPETGTFVILLTSRLHPNGKKPGPSALRREVATLAAAAIVDAPVRAPSRSAAVPAPSSVSRRNDGRVLCGIDVLVQEGFSRLRGQRVGLVTNHTGRTRDGRTTIDVFFQAPGVKLVRLFSPEHGIRGAVDAAVPDSKDARTGLPIVSLYGRKRKPAAADLEGLDVLVFDVQDIGVRYYTYSSTLGLVLEAAKESGKRLVVLDRPNPLGGNAVAGPVRDDDLASFIAYHTLPVQHGLTLGELARLYNGERKLGANLKVVPCRGWSRAQTYDRTGLPWINPSPNMRSLTEALLYPGVGWLEATNLATGRGTDTPFERVGASWIDPVRLTQTLNAAGIPGTRFVPIWFTPSERQYKGERCGGVNIVVTDWSSFEPLKLGLTLAVTLKKLYPKEWKPEGVLRMLGDHAAYNAIVAGRGVEEIEALWRRELDEFRRIRQKYLLYR
ncbi:MAG: exo-beta-N-acetylmuramidase NamZ domain-containing protein [Isosphaeraceae bacterium]